jgi:hypothetical protein
MAKEPKIPARVARLVRYLENGRTLCLHIGRSEVGDEFQYWIEPDGFSVGKWTVDRALSMGLIRAQNDGLFPDAAAQTYVVV